MVVKSFDIFEKWKIWHLRSSCMKRLLVRIRSNLLVTIIYKCTKITTIYLTLNTIIFTSIKVIKNIYTQTQKFLKMPSSLKLGLNENCSLFWGQWHNVAHLKYVIRVFFLWPKWLCDIAKSYSVVPILKAIMVDQDYCMFKILTTRCLELKCFLLFQQLFKNFHFGFKKNYFISHLLKWRDI